jgi:hypothetical protein
MKRILILFLLTFVAPLLRAQDIAGDWQGALDTGMGSLRLVLHITKASDGTLAATLDSVDQAANGIPVKSVTLKDSKLSLDVAAVQGTYEGTVAPDGKSISGTWSQGKPLPLEFKKAAGPLKTEHKVAKPSDIDGTWTGTLDSGMGKLRVVFHIVNTEDGLVATIDSPDQGAKGIPTSLVARSGNSLTIEAKGINGVFKGKIAADLSSIDGTWTQGSGEMPLVLKRSKDQAEMEHKRAQPSDIESA